MTTLYPSFEDFLKDEHAGQYTGIDDNMSEDFDKWLSELDTEELIKQADNYAAHRMVEIKKNITHFIQDLDI
jgi:hypothetical protein